MVVSGGGVVMIVDVGIFGMTVLVRVIVIVLVLFVDSI